MNENDKILITAYLDGETSDDETKYIESLLESNSEANEYSNYIKKANNEINSFFNSSDIKELDIDVSKFIDDIKSKKYKINFWSNLVKPQSFLGYALAASIAYYALLPSNINNENIMMFNGDLSMYSQELGYVDYPKYRGDSDVDESLKNLLTETIDFMIENKLINTVMTYGSNSYYIKLENIEVNEKNRYCLKGYYKHKNDDQYFIQCQTLNEKTISFN